MKFWIDQLYQALSTSMEIIIYGAGQYAKEVYPVLKKMGFRQKIKAFVVTDASSAPSDIDGIVVCSFKEIQVLDMKNTTVLIAVCDVYYWEIMQTIQRYIFRQLLLLKSFIISEVELEQCTNIEFLEYIRETYIWSQVSSIQEFNCEIDKHRKWIEKRSKEDVNNKEIVFIIGNFGSRYINIIGSLYRNGYAIKILEYGNSDLGYIKDSLLSDYTIECVHCFELEELFFYALQEKPLVYYIEPIWGDCSCPEIMIRHKKIFGKIVLSLYDVLNDGYICVSDYEKKTERYSLENADGVVWRWYSKEFLQEQKGFVFKGRSIQFLDYCGKCEISENLNNENKLKLCMIIGSVAFLLQTNFNENGTYIDLAKIEHILEIVGNQESCIFHLFVGQCSSSDREVCNALEQKYWNIKFFYTLQHNELIHKVSEYDYGCLIYNDNPLPPYRGVMSMYNYGSGYYNASTNKLFDYISAGIPFITTGPFKLCKFFEQYDVVVKMNISNLDIDYLISNRITYKENARKARVDLLVDKHIQKLIGFLNNL